MHEARAGPRRADRGLRDEHDGVHARLYNAIRASSSSSGSNYLNTTLLVTFDEQAAPTTTSSHHPRPRRTPHACGPVRIHVQPFRRTHPHARDLAMDPGTQRRHREYRATSLISTLRDRWNLGTPFTGRDATARSFASVFTLDKPRAQSDWPELSPVL